MSASLAPFIKQQFFDSNGNPLSGGKIYSYQSGTTTPQVTYTDATGVTPNANPVILDANGEANIWLDQSLSYKFVIKTSADVSLRTIDGVVGVLTNNAVTTAALQDSSVTSAKIAAGGVARSNLAVGAVAYTSQTGVKVTNYTATASDDTIRCDVSAGSFTVTLPTAVGIQGRRYKIIQVGALSANLLTIDANLSETINGALTRSLGSQYEMMEIESDGANWLITNRFIPSAWTLYTPTYTGFGTAASSDMWWRRVGDSIALMGRFVTGTPTAAAASVSLPGSIVVDSTKAATTRASGSYLCGNAGGRTNHGGEILITGGASVVNFGDLNTFSGASAGTSMITAQLGNAMSAAGDFISIEGVMIPIAGWEG